MICEWQLLARKRSRNFRSPLHSVIIGTGGHFSSRPFVASSLIPGRGGLRRVVTFCRTVTMIPSQRDKRRRRVVLRLGVAPSEVVTLMALAGLTARQLAERAGWRSHASLTRILRGEVSRVRADRAVLIAEALGVGVDDLFVPCATTVPGHGDRSDG